MTEAVEPEKTLPRPTLLGAMGWCLALAIYSALLVLPCYLLVDYLLEGRPPPAVLFVAASISVFVVASLITLRALGDEIGQALALRAPSLLHLLLVVLLAPPQALLAIEVGNWAAEVFPMVDAPPSSAISITLLRDVGRMYEEMALQPWWLILLAACLLPALGEEAFFRGFLGRGFVARAGPLAGVLLTSLLFGLMHLHPQRVCVTAFGGIGMHLAFLATGSFWSPVLLHCLHNAIVFGTVHLALYGNLDLTGVYAGGHLPFGTVLASGCATALLWYLLCATRTRWLLTDDREWSPGYVSAEAPPPDVHATAHVIQPRPLALLAGVGGSLLFVITALSQAELVGPRAAQYWIERGTAHMNQGKHESAITDFTRAIRLDPSHAYAHVNRGLALLHLERFPEAIADFDTAIRLAPRMADAYLNRGVARAYLSANEAAIADYTEALRLNPDLVQAHANRGLAHFARGDPDRAVADLTEAIRREPSVDHYVWRGQVYLAKESFTEAIRDFTEAIRLDPTHAEAYYLRGLAHQGVEDEVRAEADFQEAIRLDPTLADRQP